MAAKTLEEVIQIVEGQQKTLEAQQKELQMLRDVHEIQNLMGRDIYQHETGGDHEFLDNTFYAWKTPGVSAEVANGGVFLGEDIRKMWGPKRAMGEMKGLLFTHPLTTPVIEVAGDGKTAKGVWISPGYETPKDPETGKLMACWVYTKYGCDFVKEDGVWKVWHYHVYRMFMTPFNIPWTEEWEHKRPSHEGPTPNGPTTYDHPYSTTTERELVPAPPEPYETWADAFSYGPD